tara:strand:+ start:703 stop:942 length:240 start_codon:yes stop_codon:yes gene_type:complete
MRSDDQRYASVIEIEESLIKLGKAISGKNPETLRLNLMKADPITIDAVMKIIGTVTKLTYSLDTAIDREEEEQEDIERN